MGSVDDAMREETAADALEIFLYLSIVSGFGSKETYGSHEFRFLHRLQSFGDRVTDFDTLLFQFIRGCS